MKLRICQVPGDGVSCKAFAIYDDRGHKLKGVTAATVEHRMGEASRITLELVVNGRDIAFDDQPPPIGAFLHEPASPPTNTPDVDTAGRGCGGEGYTGTGDTVEPCEEKGCH